VVEQDPAWDPDIVARYIRKYERRHTAELSEAEAVAATRLARCPPGGHVLDCPCGYGRHALPLGRRGYRVVGVDVSDSMLAEARRRAGANHPPRWVRADYRRLPFRWAAFDTVLNLFTSFGFYGEDADARVLDEFRRVLRPGGRLVLDTTHRDRLVRSFEASTCRMLGDGTILVEQHTFDLRTGWLETRHRYLHDDDEPSESISRLRVYSTTELAKMLGTAGFRQVEFFGGLDGRTLSPDGRLVAVATR
jgi:ubiquinone/menaquinone biosynthesis C-methylase UbiE